MKTHTAKGLCPAAVLFGLSTLYASIIGVSEYTNHYGDFVGNAEAQFPGSYAWGTADIWDYANFLPFNSYVQAWGTNPSSGIEVFEDSYENVDYAFAGFNVDAAWLNAMAEARVVDGPSSAAYAF